MEEIKIEATTYPKESDIQIIDEGLSKYNDSKIGPQKYIPLGCFARVNNIVIGGIEGSLFWNYLFIDQMWIDSKYRGKGIGRKLISEIEKLALENGINRSHLYTASFQSVGFYEKCGYKIFGKLEEMPKGETEYYLYKLL